MVERIVSTMGDDALRLQRLLPDRLGQEVNLRRGAHAVGDNMADAAGHHRQGDVKSVQAVAEARGQVEHRTIGQQIDGFVGHAVGVDIRHHLFLRVLAQVLAVDLFRHVADVKDKDSRFRALQRLAINHVFPPVAVATTSAEAIASCRSTTCQPS